MTEAFDWRVLVHKWSGVEPTERPDEEKRRVAKKRSSESMEDLKDPSTKGVCYFISFV